MLLSTWCSFGACFLRTVCARKKHTQTSLHTLLSGDRVCIGCLDSWRAFRARYRKYWALKMQIGYLVCAMLFKAEPDYSFFFNCYLASWKGRYQLCTKHEQRAEQPMLTRGCRRDKLIHSIVTSPSVVGGADQLVMTIAQVSWLNQKNKKNKTTKNKTLHLNRRVSTTIFSPYSFTSLH